MFRSSGPILRDWYSRRARKPLIVRGARQVGKSTLVRQVAAALGVPLWEVNLERHSGLDGVFASFDVDRILRELAIVLNRAGVGRGSGVLFLDEIQAAPHAIAALRYFAEDRSDLAVIAAGSLIEFALASAPFSMPVGRVTYHWLGPMGFEEFLAALGEEVLLEIVRTYRLGADLPVTAHERLIRLLREYLYVGGMPEAVALYAEHRDPPAVAEVHRSITETYRDDFAKYASGADLEKLRRVYDALPSNLGEKVRYTRFHPDWRSVDIRGCLESLERAGIATPAVHTDGVALPLGATEDPTVTKLFHLDVGLAGTAAGLGPAPIEQLAEGRLINEGVRAEQFVAQHLLLAQPRDARPSLHYWQRGGRSTNAEVDFVVPAGSEVLPIEVKSGSTGSLRSLHQFMLRHPDRTALRLDLNPPSVQEVRTEVMTAEGKRPVRYRLVNLPVYLAGRSVDIVRSRPPA